MYVCVFVCHCLATKVFICIGQLPATGCVCVCVCVCVFVFAFRKELSIP